MEEYLKKEELFEYLRDNLSINIRGREDDFTIELSLEGNTISETSLNDY